MKAKLRAILGKVESSQIYQKGTKTALALSAGGLATGLMAVQSFAVDWGATITSSAAIESISEGASPFVEPAILIMCAVSGLKLGMKFLRGSAR